MTLLQLALQKNVVRRAAYIALVVGTLLALINHGGALINGTFDLENTIQVALTYLVPYGVSTYSSVSALEEHSREAQR